MLYEYITRHEVTSFHYISIMNFTFPMNFICIFIYFIHNQFGVLSAGCPPLHSKESVQSLISMLDKNYNINTRRLNDSCVTFIEPIVMKNAKKLLCNYTLFANINQCREPPVIIEAFCAESKKCKQAFVATFIEVQECSEHDYSILQDLVVYQRKCGCHFEDFQ